MIAAQTAAPPSTRASARRAGAPRAGERQPDDERDGEGGAGETRVIEPEERRPLRDDEERASAAARARGE